MKGLRRLVLLSLLAAVATVLGYVESLLPPLLALAPGVKLGLANIVSLFALYRLGARDAFAVVLVRCLLSALLWGGPLSLAYSLCGGLLSCAGMALLRRLGGRWLSIFGVSMAGAALHHVGQLAAATLLLNGTPVFYYLPYMTLLALPTGLFVAAAALGLLRAADRAGLARPV